MIVGALVLITDQTVGAELFGYQPLQDELAACKPSSRAECGEISDVDVWELERDEGTYLDSVDEDEEEPVKEYDAIGYA